MLLVSVSDLAAIGPLFFAAFAAGLVDSIGGGGGLITVPTLLNIGIPAPLLLGTNKSMSTLGSLPAVYRYARAGLLPRLPGRFWLLLIGLCILFSIGGAILSAQALFLEQIGLLIPLLLVGVMVFMLKRWFWDEKNKKKKKRDANLGPEDMDPNPERKLIHPKPIAGIVGIAAYDGMFGPGTGTFFLSWLEGFGVRTITANAMTKVFNLSSNIGALIYFALHGRVAWPIGFSAAGFYLVGNYIGAGLVLRKGQGLVRIVVLTATSLLILRSLYLYLSK